MISGELSLRLFNTISRYKTLDKEESNDDVARILKCPESKSSSLS